MQKCYINDMALRKKTIRTEELGADFLGDGVSVSPDWRYDVLMDYLSASHSFQAVLKSELGKKSKYRLPVDFDVVKAVVDDFGDFRELGERRWWRSKGAYLFGFKALTPEARILGQLQAAAPTLITSWKGVDSVVVEIPLNLASAKAKRQVMKLLSGLQFSMPLPASEIAPKYQLKTNRLRRETLTAGAAALIRYDQGWPLWKIGNWLRLIPTLSFDEEEAESHPDHYVDHKKALATVARRLVKFAALVAENAARGRFLTNSPFPEAMLETYQRPAGRPKGSTKNR